ncbi:hypothetical protein [Erwinia phage Virsaitis27]|nr:hypothetical protein [Erwinia phage Virsaitis27]
MSEIYFLTGPELLRTIIASVCFGVGFTLCTQGIWK